MTKQLQAFFHHETKRFLKYELYDVKGIVSGFVYIRKGQPDLITELTIELLRKEKL